MALLPENCLGKGCDQVRGVLNRFLDAIADPVFVKNSAYQWQFVNQAYSQLVGYSPEDLLGKSELDIFPANQAQPFRQADQQVLHSGQECEYKATITDVSGQNHVVLARTSLFQTQGGDSMLVGTLRDITEQQQAEYILKRKSEREHP
jgi:PAS domain S-box-containing protein